MSPDPELTQLLADARKGRVGDVAAAVVDLAAEPAVSFGFLGAADADRPFELGSISKALTGMLLADAITRGEVTLETTVGTIAPEIATVPLGAVTLGQLATHTSGLPRLARNPASAWRAVRFAYFGRDPYRGLTPERVLRDAARQRLSQPGERSYSNLGGALCGQLLVRAAGASDFAELLHVRIAEPLGLTHTFVSARGHTAPPGRSQIGTRRQPWIMDGYAPAGGVVSTIGDLALLAGGLLSGAAPGRESMVPIDAEVVGERRSGMFWVVQPAHAPGQQLVWHNGGTGGYSTFLALLPERGRAVAVLSSVGQEGGAERLAAGLMRTMTAP